MKRLLLICGLVLLACQALIVNAQSLSVTYYHTDALGSVVAATDENGDLRWKKSYLAYGQAQGDDNDNRFGYTGHTEESDGLVYTGARYYHPGIGRFISPDPVGFLESNSASFNRYAYANNNPYRYTDPNGQLPIIPIVIGVIKVADMAITAYDVYSAAQSGGALGAAEAVAENVKYNVVPGGKVVKTAISEINKVSEAARSGKRQISISNNYKTRIDPSTKGEGGYHIHVMDSEGKEVARVNGDGGYSKAHGGKSLSKPSELPKKVRSDITRIIKNHLLGEM